MESKIQSEIVKLLGKHGYVVRVSSSTKAGVPDVLACVKGRFIAVEVKDVGKKPAPLQIMNLALINAAGGIAIYADDVDKVKKVIYEL